MQKYPRGSRGSPAKGVVPVTVARVRISPSAPKREQGIFSLFPFCLREANRSKSRVPARTGEEATVRMFGTFFSALRRRRFAAWRQYLAFCAKKGTRDFFLVPFLLAGGEPLETACSRENGRSGSDPLFFPTDKKSARGCRALFFLLRPCLISFFPSCGNGDLPPLSMPSCRPGRSSTVRTPRSLP